MPFGAWRRVLHRRCPTTPSVARGLRTWRGLAAPILLGLVATIAAAADRAYVVEHDGRSVELQVTRDGSDELFDVADVANFLGLSLDRTNRKRLVLTGPAGSVELQVGRALVLVNGQPVLLESDVRRVRDRVYVPLGFLTRAAARLLGTEARLDAAARSVRFDRVSDVARCETFADRTRVTLRVETHPDLSDIAAEGKRRVVVVKNLELPAQVGGCHFDETLADLEIRPSAGQTVLTFFVGPRFARMEVYELADSHQLVFDLLNTAGTSTTPPPEASLAPASSAGSDVFDTVVIDPGHGGADLGAVGRGGLREKDVCLAIALELARSLRDRAGLDVVLTRTSDESVALTDRTAVANARRADLLLSIHANATASLQAHGAETYFLSVDATDESARSTAAFENDATGLRQRGGAGGGPLELLLWDMAQQQYLEESSALADVVQREMNELAGTRDRGVRQADFVVLRGATMPAVLVEVGFISNPTEERSLRTAEFQHATAEALHRAVLAFRSQRQARQAH